MLWPNLGDTAMGKETIPAIATTLMENSFFILVTPLFLMTCCRGVKRCVVAARIQKGSVPSQNFNGLRNRHKLGLYHCRWAAAFPEVDGVWHAVRVGTGSGFGTNGCAMLTFVWKS